jgi:triacylglycerol lipase
MARAPGEHAPGPEPPPVLLVPGWSDGPHSLWLLERRLKRAGWPGDRVRRLGFRNRCGSNREHAREIAAAVTEFVHCAAVPAIDVVAHSMGGLAVREYLRQHGERAGIRRVAFLGTPHAGTIVARLAWGGGAPEMRPGSDFLLRLAEAGLPPAVRSLTIRARFDLRVIPAFHGVLAGSPDVVLPWTTHRGLLRSPRAHTLLMDFLTAD